MSQVAVNAVARKWLVSVTILILIVGVGLPAVLRHRSEVGRRAAQSALDLPEFRRLVVAPQDETTISTAQYDIISNWDAIEGAAIITQAHDLRRASFWPNGVAVPAKEIVLGDNTDSRCDTVLLSQSAPWDTTLHGSSSEMYLGVAGYRRAETLPWEPAPEFSIHYVCEMELATELTLVMTSTSQLDNVIEVMRSFYGPGVTIKVPPNLEELRAQVSQSMSTTSRSVAIASLVAAALAVASSMTGLVIVEQRHLALRRALGFSRWHILALVMGQVVTVTAIALPVILAINATLLVAPIDWFPQNAGLLVRDWAVILAVSLAGTVPGIAITVWREPAKLLRVP